MSVRCRRVVPESDDDKVRPAPSIPLSAWVLALLVFLVHLLGLVSPFQSGGRFALTQTMLIGHSSAGRQTWWDDRLPTYRRTREHHRPLLRHAISLIIRLFHETPRVAAQWRAPAPQLTSVPFWHDYLGIPYPAITAALKPAMTDGN